MLTYDAKAVARFREAPFNAADHPAAPAPAVVASCVKELLSWNREAEWFFCLNRFVFVAVK